MADFENSPTETDERFPSGPWTGFFLQSNLTGRVSMSLRLAFRGGFMRGEGRDRIGEFEISGRYELENGKCHWTKKYVGKHEVNYDGFNEGKGIWGLWNIGATWKGGFHIWPDRAAEGESGTLSTAIEEPELVGAEG